MRMDTIRPFFSKIRALFLIFKKGQGRPPTRVALKKPGVDKVYVVKEKIKTTLKCFKQ